MHGVQEHRLAADAAWDRYLGAHRQSSGGLAELRGKLLQTRLDMSHTKSQLDALNIASMTPPRRHSPPSGSIYH